MSVSYDCLIYNYICTERVRKRQASATITLITLITAMSVSVYDFTNFWKSFSKLLVV
jgi:hypothetical protein